MHHGFLIETFGNHKKAQKSLLKAKGLTQWDKDRKIVWDHLKVLKSADSFNLDLRSLRLLIRYLILNDSGSFFQIVQNKRDLLHLFELSCPLPASTKVVYFGKYQITNAMLFPYQPLLP